MFYSERISDIMKKMRRIAVMLSAMMTFSAIGGMSAFADDMITLTESSDTSKTGSVGLQLRNTPATAPEGTKTATWYITVDTANLTWEVKENISPDTLHWNGTSYDVDSYGSMTRTFDETANLNNTATDVEGKFDKTATITNKCNFNLTEITQSLTYNGDNALFNLVSANLTSSGTSIGRNGTFAVTVRPNVDNINLYLESTKMSLFDSEETVNVGSVGLTFTGDTTNLY